jgi:hypothetical protein
MAEHAGPTHPVGVVYVIAPEAGKSFGRSAARLKFAPTL